MTYLIWGAVFVGFALFTWKAMGIALGQVLDKLTPEQARVTRAVITILDAALMTGIVYYIWTSFVA